MKKRRSVKLSQQLYQLPLMPFFSIMLGLMSVMALTTIGISIEQRQELNKRTTVELTGIPANFVPLHIRCHESGIRWLDGRMEWQETSLLELLTIFHAKLSKQALPADSIEFYTYLRIKAEENKNLSFSRRQNTLILWVEPGGIDTATVVQYILDDYHLPLRVGLLPIMTKEEIYYDGSVSE